MQSVRWIYITVRFINQKICEDALERNYEVNKHNDNSKLGLNVENKSLLWELNSLQPAPCFNVQGVKESKEDLWTSKETIKLKLTMNEWTISVDHRSETKSLYPDFVFREREMEHHEEVLFVFSTGISSKCLFLC